MRSSRSKQGRPTIPRATFVALAAAASLTIAPALAQAPGGDVIARVGSRVITVQEMDARIAAIPPYQLRTLGSTPDEIRRNFLGLLLRDALFAQGAEANEFRDRPEVRDRIQSILRGALLTQIRTEASAEKVSDDEVRAYYDANRSKFESPPRIAIWRILTDKLEDAEAVIADLKTDDSAKHWNEVARERSVDKATNMRGGNLGFVAPDGTNGENGVRIDPAVYAAADQVKDGELVPRPVKEGQRFAVIWKRQSMKAVSRTLEQEAPSIRQVIAHAKTEEKVTSLLQRLREETQTEVHPELVDQLDIGSSGDIQAARRPGSLATSRRPAAAPPAPVQGPSGLR